jgi:hypothetical protein
VTDCIILVRTPAGKVIVLMDDDGDVAVYADFHSANAATFAHPLCKAYDSQIVELDI